MIRSFILLLALIAANGPAFAQESVGGAYYGDTLLHPGASVFYEWNHKLGRAHEVGVKTNAGFYYHRRLATHVFLVPEGVYRFTLGYGIFVHGTLGAGYLHAFYSGDVYEKRGNRFEEVPLAGRGYLMPTFGFGFGQNLSALTEQPVSWFASLKGDYRYPYNDTWNLHPTLEVGVAYHFDSLMFEP